MAFILACTIHGSCETAMIDRDVILQKKSGKPPAVVRIPHRNGDLVSFLTISIENFMKYNVYESLNNDGSLEDPFFIYETEIDFGPICAECFREWLLPKK